MKARWMLTLVAAAIPLLAVATGTWADDRNEQGNSKHDGGDSPAVYTQTNAAEGNEILVFRRNSRGVLKLTDEVSTRGIGTGAGLGSQGALALSRDGEHLYAVNAGSDSISIFERTRRGLSLIQRVSSGGDQPISLTLHYDVLYVLNAGAPGNITGFRVNRDGRLRVLAGSTRPLSGPDVMPAQVQFNNTGDFLVVTEKATNKIDLYSVEDYVAAGPNVNDSNGVTPFGFDFDRRDRLVVSEAFMGQPGQSAVSSYDFDAADAPLEVISGSVNAGQTAACWVVTTRNGRYAYVTNTGSGTITSLRIARSGELSVLAAVAANTGSGSAPQDLALSRGSHFLFSLQPGTGTLHSFRVRDDGSLARIDTAHGIPASAQGLAAN